MGWGGIQPCIAHDFWTLPHTHPLLLCTALVLQNEELELQYKTCYARILDSKRRFLEAATRYYELSQVGKRRIGDHEVGGQEVGRRVGRGSNLLQRAQPRGQAQNRTSSRRCRAPSRAQRLHHTLTSAYPHFRTPTHLQVSEDDLEQALQSAITCAVLAAAGPQRSRMLATLYKDERCAKLALFPFLEKVYLERILQAAEVGCGWGCRM